MPMARTHYADLFPVALFLETALEAKMESRRLRSKSDRISQQIPKSFQYFDDDNSQKVVEILSQELTWVQEDIQRCADRYAEVEKLIDKLPLESDRVIMRCYYLYGFRGGKMAMKFHEEYGVYYSPKYLEKRVTHVLEFLQSIYEMEMLCV